MAYFLLGLGLVAELHDRGFPWWFWPIVLLVFVVRGCQQDIKEARWDKASDWVARQ